MSGYASFMARQLGSGESTQKESKEYGNVLASYLEVCEQGTEAQIIRYPFPGNTVNPLDRDNKTKHSNRLTTPLTHADFSPPPPPPPPLSPLHQHIANNFMYAVRTYVFFCFSKGSRGGLKHVFGGWVKV